MIDGGAVGIGSAWPSDAGVSAGVVAELAVLDVGAVAVHHTLQDRDAHSCNKEYLLSHKFLIKY